MTFARRVMGSKPEGADVRLRVREPARWRARDAEKAALGISCCMRRWHSLQGAHRSSSSAWKPRNAQPVAQPTIRSAKGGASNRIGIATKSLLPAYPP